MKTFFTRLGKYLLSLLILILTMGFSDLGEGFVSIPNSTIGYFILFGLPFIALIPKKFFNGLLLFTIVTVFVDFVAPQIGEALNSISPSGESVNRTNNVPGSSRNGAYSDVSDGIIIKILIVDDNWYGEHIDERTGSVLNSSFGTVHENKILDNYGFVIGKIKNNKVIC